MRDRASSCLLVLLLAAAACRSEAPAPPPPPPAPAEVAAAAGCYEFDFSRASWWLPAAWRRVDPADSGAFGHLRVHLDTLPDPRTTERPAHVYVMRSGMSTGEHGGSSWRPQTGDQGAVAGGVEAYYFNGIDFGFSLTFGPRPGAGGDSVEGVAHFGGMAQGGEGRARLLGRRVACGASGANPS